MDKKDILEKFKIENALVDEREQYIDLKSYSYGITFSIITFLLVFVISNLNNLEYSGAKLMFLSILLGNALYKYIKDRKNMGKFQKITYITFLIGGGILYIAYLVELIGLKK